MSEQPECCEGEMDFIRGTATGDALFRCPVCGNKEVFAANLCPLCTEPLEECVCAALGLDMIPEELK